MADGATYRVDLSVFNGPLDLLLYLIRERELDIQDIPIAEICDQYLGYLGDLEAIDIDSAGEFVLMAATLMLIKSRTLLPQVAEDEEEDDFDPRSDLVRQLLEYKRYKDLSRRMEDSREVRDARFEGGVRAPGPEAADPGKLLEDLGVQDLLLAFERLMRETLADVDHAVQGEVLPLREVMADVTATLTEFPQGVAFVDLFRDRRDRPYVITVFLSLLELLRLRRITLEPGDDVVDLRLRLREVEATDRDPRMPAGDPGPERLRGGAAAPPPPPRRFPSDDGNGSGAEPS